MGIELELDPELMAGQMVVGGFEGKALPAAVEDALAKGRLSGVILFGRNLGTPVEVRALTDAIRMAAAIPPFIAIDHEGGRVERLVPPFTRWPTARSMGQKGSAALMKDVARAMAAELLAVGVNLNLAPVLDVDSNPNSPVIGDRSFGPDPNRVGRLGAAMIEGFSRAGLVSCAKHFPGHGDADIDSHLDLPVIDADRTTLERRELVPFQEAVKARVPMIMTAHLKATALDKYYPATISAAVITGLLREQMGFEGVVITDDLEMGALAKYMPLGDAVFSAARAGVDLMLIGSGPERAEEARQALVEGMKTGVIDFGGATLAIKRIMAIKESFLLRPLPDKKAISEVVGRAEHRDLAASLGAG